MPSFRLLPLAAPLLLSACSALSALSDATQELAVFELRAPSGLPEAAQARRLDVIVEEPSTTGALLTDRIMIRPSELEAQYLPGARWGEEVPVMVQSLMVRSLQATGGFAYVGREPLGLSGDVAVVSDVIDFQARDLGDAAEVTLRVSVQLVRERDVAILASRTFTAGAVSASLSNGDIVAAFDAASDQLMGDFAGWVLDGLR
ncbi:ABC-type transport auxiliary lipoprotein family protein [Roseivivax sp. GX 12232]|uniref:ABC-type transport auxiliary lipoprotein family protein n=1 Tax=Roseivivax sp. GX 12232 TaxID=2900547 RepID=UPI001E464FC6|nr:ABC-type transport auxiliary lipoprotein family protein [Roseivivax sp. GX 12232]MCE0505342.1 ABC-type transport auxiliary lipoprotein family protein [Roseivivax sp. GX 12232]